MEIDTPIHPLVRVEDVQQRILVLRGQRVIIDADLARLYGVTTKRLNEQVKRNMGRFPDDFVFQLTANERQEVVAKCDHLRKLRFSASRPFAFTEHGAIMAATVLNSEQAVRVSVFVVRAFVKLRELLATHQQLAAKLNELESKLQNHDGQIQAIIDAIRQLTAEPRTRRKPPIGFHTEAERGRSKVTRARSPRGSVF